MAMKRRGFLAGTATLVAAGGGCITVSATETTETSRHEIGDERVTIDNPAGDVTVRTADREDVRVRAVKRDSMGNEDALSKLSVTTDRSDGVFTVAVEDDTDPGLADTTSLDLTVTVPTSNRVTDVDVADGDVDLRETVGDLTVDADDSDVSVRSVDGAVTVEAGDGDLTVRDVSGDATATLDDGDATIRDVSGDATATLGDGDATVRRVEGTVTVDASDGDLTVRDPGAIDEVTAGDGDVTVEVPAVSENAVVSAGDGDLDLALSPSLDAELALSIADGDLSVDGFDFVAGEDVTRLETTLGDGTHSLSVSAGDGDVTVSRL